jgi:RNA exonuclease 1
VLPDAPPGRMLGVDTEYVEVASGGTAVGRIAVIQLDCFNDLVATLLDTYVRVDEPVVDYKSDISGLTPENTRGGISPEGLLAWWDENITPTDFVCTHDADCDFAALRIDQRRVPRILDTMLLWPHHDGPPFKHRLQFLAAQFLGAHIQVPGCDAASNMYTHTHTCQQCSTSYR